MNEWILGSQKEPLARQDRQCYKSNYSADRSSKKNAISTHRNIHFRISGMMRKSGDFLSVAG
jgi:hypothetical protein